MTHTFHIGEELDCTLSALPGRWMVEEIEPAKGNDEPRLTVRSTDPNYDGQNPVMITASACAPVAEA